MMMDFAWKRQLLSATAEVQKIYEAVSAATDPSARNASELVRIRRTIMDRISAVSNIIDQAPTAPNHHRLKSTFSEFRAGLAEHQANWPAVMMQDSILEYRASLQRVATRLAQFVEECHRS